MSLLIKNAAAVITCDNQDSVFSNANLVINGGVIQSITQDQPEGIFDQVIDATGHAVYPGLINTHHHLYQTFSRNLPAVQNLELFDWLTNLYEIWKHLDEEAVYYSSLVGIGELLKYGCTTCFDHHYVFVKDSTPFLEAQAQAGKDLNARLYLSRGGMSRSKKDGGLPPDSVVQDTATILKNCQEAVERFHDPSRYSMLMMALAPCSPFSVTEDLMIETAKLARSLNVRLHTHLAETKDEERYVTERHGMRPLAYLESLGWIGPDVWYAHGIHFNDEELQRLADTKTGVAHCPASNMKLSSGVCRVPDMLRLGVPVGLAVDGSASNDNSNLLEEIRVAYLLHRLTYSDKAPSGYDILKMATRGSASILGRDDIGSLEAGKAADLFLINLNRLELTGAALDPMNLFGTVGFASPADYVVVNGRLVAEKGRLLTIDEETAAQKARDCVNRYLSKN